MGNKDEHKTIALLKEVPGVTPVVRGYFENWSIRAFSKSRKGANNYLSPNRRDYYKVMLIENTSGLLTIGMDTYYIDCPTILFIHPNEIISWKGSADSSTAYYCLFKKRLADGSAPLKNAIDKYQLFSNTGKSIIKLSAEQTGGLIELFSQMFQAEHDGSDLAEDTIQAYLLLIMIQSVKIANYPIAEGTSEEFKHIHQFFVLLESRMAGVNYMEPLVLKTAQQFAMALKITPNYLNALLKKHTGRQVSYHIRMRLLEECKSLLLQTNWSLENISYSTGFSDQPNFSAFFKKQTGCTPAAFRKKNKSCFSYKSN